ncbi:MAG: hypothetical protein UX61_C0003G0001 [Parcubacteria group bacterium GW2011_GWA2_46_7]|nr:MAG: hypothetical protein UX14_C0002G0008 [Parcubacteria group bacterium GW2011_GWF1_45_5]KKU44272.1 MAG: hypothetical protein UX61_C0003G0001 [Parcubacteria group bacterium GW2011_GWA2_46_7]
MHRVGRGFNPLSAHILSGNLNSARLSFVIRYDIVLSMIITWYGLSCIKLETQDTVLVCNPFGKDAQWGADRSPRFRANIACVSVNNPLYNTVSGIEGTPFIITSPGEYEIGGITVVGVPCVSDKGGANTVFVIRAEGLTVVHLGAWSGSKIPEQVRTFCSGSDIFCVPIGGDGLADSGQAATVAMQLEANIVIPLMYHDASAQKESGPVAKLVKAMNVSVEYQDRLSIRKKDISRDRTSIIVLHSQLAK